MLVYPYVLCHLNYIYIIINYIKRKDKLILFDSKNCTGKNENVLIYMHVLYIFETSSF